MAATTSEEQSALFPIFILTIMALPLVPYTIIKLFRSASEKTTSINCQCSVCFRSGKYRKSIFKRVNSFMFIHFHVSVSCLNCYVFNFFLKWFQISNFSTYSNLTLVLLWVIMAVLVYYIKHISSEVITGFCLILLWFYP